jgi:hypothetical protein
MIAAGGDVVVDVVCVDDVVDIRWVDPGRPLQILGYSWQRSGPKIRRQLKG